MPVGGLLGAGTLVSFTITEGTAALECLAAELAAVFGLGQRIRQSLEEAHCIGAHAAAPESVRPYVLATTTTIQ